MRRRAICLMGLVGLASVQPAAALSPNWEKLTGPEFAKALVQAAGVCILPIASVDASGPAEPVGTNLLVVRAVVDEAVKQEYAIVFPEYLAGTANDFANLQGTISYSSSLQHEMIVETTEEMGRNGCRKVLIVNGHGGNSGLLNDFLHTNLDVRKSYVIYVTSGNPPEGPPTGKVAAFSSLIGPSKPGADGHGGEERTSLLLAVDPNLVHPERARDESALRESALQSNLPTGTFGVQTGAARMVQAPNGYFGDPSGATVARGTALLKFTAVQVVNAIRAVKADDKTPAAQERFFAARAHPGQ